MNDRLSGGAGGGEAGATVAWRELLAEARARLGAADVEGVAGDVEARWMVERATGLVGDALLAALDGPATVRGVAHLDAMVERRLSGEPIQYVLGRWAFRQLDLLVDRRVLIPRPETEQVVEASLRALDGQVPDEPVVVDLGTGSGAIALSIATERPRSRVWATDASPDALSVARANTAGLGRAGRRVTLLEGEWFAPLPRELLGRVDLLISNPPYIGNSETLPVSVERWEPARALRAGPRGDEQIEVLLRDGRRWLAPVGSLVLEMAPAQVGPAIALATTLGYAEPAAITDLAGLDRGVVVHRSHASAV